jgi:hypothetical protein
MYCGGGGVAFFSHVWGGGVSLCMPVNVWLGIFLTCDYQAFIRSWSNIFVYVFYQEGQKKTRESLASPGPKKANEGEGSLEVHEIRNVFF